MRVLWKAQPGWQVRRLSARPGDGCPVPALRQCGDGDCRGSRAQLRRPLRSGGAPASGMSRRQRLTLLAAICGSAVATIDGAIVNVALPAIGRDLGGGLASQEWVANAYLLSLGSLILLGGSLGDVWGGRRVFTIGIAAFGAFSLACALAQSISLLVAARALQGAAGALVTPSSLAIIVAAFPPEQRGRAVGSWTAWSGIALVAGPLA